MNSSHSASRDNNFNLLRIVAASLVLMSHSFLISTGLVVSEPLHDSLGITWGRVAVDVFFVTSGFLVTGSLMSRKSLAAFGIARFLRIYPGLWSALALTVIVAGTYETTLSPMEFFLNSETWKYLIKNGSVLKAGYLLPGVFESNPWKGNINGSLWTLPWEIRMYFFLALFWLLSRRLPGEAANNFAKVCLLVASVCLVGNFARIALNIPVPYSSLGFMQYFSLGYMFFAGSVLCLFQQNIPLTFKLAGPMLAAILISALDRTIFGFVYVTCLPYLVMYLALVPGGRIRKFNRFGDCSYGIYIYAFPVQQTLAFMWKGIGPYQMMWSSFLVTLCLSIASWELVEKRALSWKHRFE